MPRCRHVYKNKISNFFLNKGLIALQKPNKLCNNANKYYFRTQKKKLVAQSSNQLKFFLVLRKLRFGRCELFSNSSSSNYSVSSN